MKLLIINPGATSTKIAVFEDEEQLFKVTIDHSAEELDRFPRGRLHLVVNRVRKKLLHSMHATIDDAMDKAGLPLIGVVPEDDALPVSLNQGTPLLLRSYNGAASAYRNIAIRLQGGKAPLLRIR